MSVHANPRVDASIANYANPRVDASIAVHANARVDASISFHASLGAFGLMTRTGIPDPMAEIMTLWREFGHGSIVPWGTVVLPVP